MTTTMKIVSQLKYLKMKNEVSLTVQSRKAKRKKIRREGVLVFVEKLCDVVG